ncbi:hypothetical protein F503_02731 [Ophiostoma piceae UAMH 11346]|uniref:Uncharacterized protein n=1 Tax=Ophiostoma piceae (strain UAMH 11346) TaxID=1262450 RepID=S3CJI8_OPHP1|nr:hypothetical protein F503_02731 [Ophiostoma piceae UAMH 11346]
MFLRDFGLLVFIHIALLPDLFLYVPLFFLPLPSPLLFILHICLTYLLHLSCSLRPLVHIHKMAAVQAGQPAFIGDGISTVPAAAVKTMTATAKSANNAPFIGDGTDDNLGAEALLYMIAQSCYHMLGSHSRQMLANRLKTMRAEIIVQVSRMPDPVLMKKVLHEYSPPLYPDLPNAPPDLPTQTTWLASVMEHVTLRDGLDPAVLHQEGWIPVDELLLRLGWHTQEQIDQIKAAAFSQGADYANGVNDWATPPKPVAQNINGIKDTLLRQAIKRAHDQDHDDGPSKRARFASTFSEGDSDSSDSVDSSANVDSLELDLNIDMDNDSIRGDAGAGTGMIDLPPRGRDHSKNKPGSWDQLWHSLPYESRLHKLGPGMTREPLLPADEFTLPLYPMHDSNDQVARYKGKGAKPRYATLDEAMANAPDDYMHCPEYFAWEVEHGRAAPAVLPKDQRLPWVPFHPAIPPAPKSVYDPKLPPGPPMADDIWPGYKVDGQTSANKAKANNTKADIIKARKTKAINVTAGRRQLIPQTDGTADEETDENADGETDGQAGQAVQKSNSGLFGLTWLWGKS